MTTIEQQVKSLQDRRRAEFDGRGHSRKRGGLGLVLRLFGIRRISEIRRLPDAIAADCIRECHALLDDIGRDRTVELAENSGDDLLCDDEGCPHYSLEHVCISDVERAVAHAIGRARCPTAGDEALADRSLPPHDPALYAEHLSEPCAAIDNLAALVHAANIAVGWWNSPYTGEPKVRNVFEMLALVHSEISEALEHHRKGTMDDKLPDRPGIEVELADAFIRIADIAAALRLDLGGAVKAKLLFNQDRADHRPENRVKSGGKAA